MVASEREDMATRHRPLAPGRHRHRRLQGHEQGTTGEPEPNGKAATMKLAKGIATGLAVFFLGGIFLLTCDRWVKTETKGKAAIIGVNSDKPRPEDRKIAEEAMEAANRAKKKVAE